MSKKKVAKKESAKKKTLAVKKKEDDSKLLAFVATFFSIIGFVVALVFKKNNKYVMHYASQSLVVFIIAVLASIVRGILGGIPILGGVIVFALWVLVTILWVFSWVYALSGEMKEIPLVGGWGRKILL